MIPKDESHHPQTIQIEASSVQELGHLCCHHRSIYVLNTMHTVLFILYLIKYSDYRQQPTDDDDFN